MGVKVPDGKLSGTTHAALNTDFRRNDEVIQMVSLKAMRFSAIARCVMVETSGSYEKLFRDVPSLWNEDNPLSRCGGGSQQRFWPKLHRIT